MPTFVWNSPQNARFAPIKVGMIAAGLIELALGDRQPRGAVVDGYPAGRVLGPLAPYAAGFVVELVERGYRPRSVSGQLELMAHLSRWLVLRAFGKGRKERVAPLSRQTVAVLKVWMRERAGLPTDPLFPTRTGGPLTRDAIERRLAKHLQTARSHNAQRCDQSTCRCTRSDTPPR